MAVKDTDQSLLERMCLMGRKHNLESIEMVGIKVRFFPEPKAQAQPQETLDLPADPTQEDLLFYSVPDLETPGDKLPAHPTP